MHYYSVRYAYAWKFNRKYVGILYASRNGGVCVLVFGRVDAPEQLHRSVRHYIMLLSVRLTTD